MQHWQQLNRELLRHALLPVDVPPQHSARLAAVALLLLEAPAGVQLLLIRRAERAGDPWSGHMALPGGHSDPEDRDLLATALRETREELGVELDAERDCLGSLEDTPPIRSRDLIVRPFVFALTRTPELAISEEVAEALWFPVQDIPSRAASASHRVELAGQSLSFPAFYAGVHPVWGFTYRVLHRLLERVEHTLAGLDSER
jgi:8-oxo-dGTP pyrophosphatase MutT (NUDIX family)